MDTTRIETTTGDSKFFAFSPHFYGYRAGPQLTQIEDWTDQVKLFLASMAYGVHHSAASRLHSPLAFVETLYRNGEAGNATPILRDYMLLERQGIVSVEERSSGRGTFVLQKPDVVERALHVMHSGSLRGGAATGYQLRGLGDQQSFRSPEINRIHRNLAQPLGRAVHLEKEIIANIRETVLKGHW